ncbi:DUF2946 domain-containing protein (plasmid) [Paraburkholderia sprentiae WSM5005]|uniref:DUF2946 domain-containing protein n=1 Tax=Paraburkholderia sprentiae WSM5005 TaxID=754502 RepID=A0A8F4QJU7_9BURK|nr:DUF2946 domain-containing protein [Paraburkholderia sprentiae]QXE07336.1 DUF2946 domain-containing protein [Paraburkholderia sprentiae WSM5005]
MRRGPPSADSGHRAHGDPLAACGYCDLLADHVAIPTLHPSPLVLITLVMIVAAPVLSTRFTPRGILPTGPPRAPPAFRQISL